jgi:hypothetical protein
MWWSCWPKSGGHRTKDPSWQAARRRLVLPVPLTVLVNEAVRTSQTHMTYPMCLPHLNFCLCSAAGQVRAHQVPAGMCGYEEKRSSPASTGQRAHLRSQLYERAVTYSPPLHGME